jgi:spore coat polysaccharide biosynthesis protein SpsF (cytidylyltransferase family)
MELKKEVLAIIQARYNSIRFPGKVIKKINNQTILEILIKRLSKSKCISKIIVACSKNHDDKEIINICKKLRINYFTGSEIDVLDRFYNAAKKYKASCIVRITADCPFIDPEIVDEVINNFFLKKVDYASNINPATFPDGLDVEAFTAIALERAIRISNSPREREHVTPAMRSEAFKRLNLTNPKDLSNLRWTVDTEADLEFVRKIFDYFHPNRDFSWNEVLELNVHRPDILGRDK